MSNSLLGPILRTMTSDVLTEDLANDQWQIFKSLRTREPELAKQTWRSLLKEGERRNFLSQFEPSNDQPSPEYGIAGLTKPGIIFGPETPPFLEAQAVILFLGEAAKHSNIRLLVQHRVNYHGHFCAVARVTDGQVLPWNEDQSAYTVAENSRISIEVFFTPTLAELDDHVLHAETEVVGGAVRSMVPFQVEVEGYPLRFMERQKYDKLEVPVDRKSEILHFPVHSESLVLRPNESARIPVWINCRQNGELIQCLCVPLVIEPKAEPAQKAV
jgi:hypothetical protein